MNRHDGLPPSSSAMSFWINATSSNSLLTLMDFFMALWQQTEDLARALFILWLVALGVAYCQYTLSGSRVI